MIMIIIAFVIRALRMVVQCAELSRTVACLDLKSSAGAAAAAAAAASIEALSRRSFAFQLSRSQLRLLAVSSQD